MEGRDHEKGTDSVVCDPSNGLAELCSLYDSVRVTGATGRPNFTEVVANL